MKVKLTLDTSILIGTVKEEEEHHQSCSELLEYINAKEKEKNIWLYEPEPLWFFEFAVNLRKQKEQVDIKGLSDDWEIENLKLVNSTEQNAKILYNKLVLSEKWEKVHVNRGADLIFLLTSFLCESTLITTDEGLKKYNGIVEIKNPSEALKFIKGIN